MQEDAKLRFFSCFAKNGRESVYGNNSAFMVNDDNILIIDVGKLAARRIDSTNILKGMKKAFLILTHEHRDHLEGVPYLSKLCKSTGTELYLVLPDNIAIIVLRIENKLKALGFEKYETAQPADVAQAMNLKSIEFEPMIHHLQNEQSITSAIIMTQQNGLKLVYATDHYDKGFVDKTIADPLLGRFYTVGTHREPGETQSHMPIRELIDVIPTIQRPDTTIMHMTSEVVVPAKIAGFHTADELLYQVPFRPLADPSKYQQLLTIYNGTKNPSRENPLKHQLYPVRHF